MPNALLYIKEEILKLHQVAELGNTERTATATGKFLKAMGMDLPESSVLDENVSSSSGVVNTMPAHQNSMSNVESSGESYFSGASTQYLTIRTEITLINSVATLKNHCKRPKHPIKHQSYGALAGGYSLLLPVDGKSKNFDLPESIKMGLDCGCPACKFLDEKSKNWSNKPDYCCGCCPVYKSRAATEDELKQDFGALHEPLETFLDSSFIGLAQQ